MPNFGNSKLYLAQTDTTAGFLSKSKEVINLAKKRDLYKPCLITVASFKELKELVRVPKKYASFIRHSKKTTFIYPNAASFRVVKDIRHAKFLKLTGWMYSSSANIHGGEFDENYAKSVADEVVDEILFSGKPSKIYKISNSQITKIRG
ncbi:MAG: Sua5 YciO YrdC YwlC family protein [Campylobacter sp.]|nr:Sua5 YciO YrdC YwlC family protein [Campylobacter sp.]